jgi:hypothetical protein
MTRKAGPKAVKKAVEKVPKRALPVAQEGEGEGLSDKEAKRVMQPAGCRAFLRRELAKEFEGITSGFVKAAKTGSVPHVKLATELLKPLRHGTRRGKGTAEKLLEEIRKNRE